MSLIASTAWRCAINLTPLSGNARQDVEIFVAGISQMKLQAHYADFCLKRPNKRDFDTTIYIYIHTYIHIYVYTHTHTHTDVTGDYKILMQYAGLT